MGRTGDTKRRILEILEQKNGTLTDISRKLDLAPSTVSQHLQELVDEGVIKQVDDRPRKWKYYEINKNRYPPIQNNNNQMPIKRWRYAIPIAVVAIALVLASLFYMSGSVQTTAAQQIYLAPGAAAPLGSTLFTISDAPTSYNITSLFVTVDNVSIHSATTGKWYKIPLQTKTFDLIQLRNISKLLSGVSLNSGIYNEIVLQISNVTAVINGSNQSVYLPTGKLRIVGAINISNTTTNWVNIDFNLENSLHIMSNGEIVMLPVLFIRHVNDDSLNLNQSTIIIAHAPGRLREFFEEGMNTNGDLIANYTTSQNVSITSSASDQFNENGPSAIPIIIRGAHGLFIGEDAGAFLNTNANGNYTNYTNYTNNRSITAPEPIIRPGLPFRKCPATANLPASSNITANSSAEVRCCGIGRPLPVAGSANLSTWNESGNESGNATAALRFGCCGYGVYPEAGNQISTVGGLCFPRIRPIPVWGNKTPIGTNISISAINNGVYINGRTNLVSSANLSIQSNASGNFVTMGCEVENGALQCNRYLHMPGIGAASNINIGT